MGIVIGVDPGVSGAVAALDGGEVVWVEDIPVYEVSVGSASGAGGRRRLRRRVDVQGLLALLRREEKVDHVCLEEVHAMPGMGVTSMFGFGRSFGIIEACIQAAGLPLHYVSPSVWKKDLRVPPDKDAARMRASELVPGGRDWWQRKKDHNRAEAALIAMYGAKTYG